MAALAAGSTHLSFPTWRNYIYCQLRGNHAVDLCFHPAACSPKTFSFFPYFFVCTSKRYIHHAPCCMACRCHFVQWQESTMLYSSPYTVNPPSSSSSHATVSLYLGVSTSRPVLGSFIPCLEGIFKHF